MFDINRRTIVKDKYDVECKDGVFIEPYITKDGRFLWREVDNSPMFDLEQINPDKIEEADILLAGVPFRFKNIRNADNFS